MWARLVHAATTLTEADLPRIGGKPTGTLRYPLELVRAVAVVWVYAGLRADEVVRLRMGCIRWQQEDVTPADTDTVLPRDAVCFLSVPVNKMSSAFVKPVNTLVGQRIAEWEQVRATSQASQRDSKSGATLIGLGDTGLATENRDHAGVQIAQAQPLTAVGEQIGDRCGARRARQIRVSR